jgi:hypothetical protein
MGCHWKVPWLPLRKYIHCANWQQPVLTSAKTRCHWSSLDCRYGIMQLQYHVQTRK